MKIFLIGNCVYLPFSNSNMKNTKYVSASISGDVFINDIYTEQELKDKWGDELKEAKSLHDVCNQWSTR